MTLTTSKGDYEKPPIKEAIIDPRFPPRRTFYVAVQYNFAGKAAPVKIDVLNDAVTE